MTRRRASASLVMTSFAVALICKILATIGLRSARADRLELRRQPPIASTSDVVQQSTGRDERGRALATDWSERGSLTLRCSPPPAASPEGGAHESFGMTTAALNSSRHASLKSRNGSRCPVVTLSATSHGIPYQPPEHDHATRIGIGLRIGDGERQDRS